MYITIAAMVSPGFVRLHKEMEQQRCLLAPIIETPRYVNKKQSRVGWG